MGNESGGGRKSDLILEEISKRKEKEQVVDVEEEKVKVVIFSLRGDWYAFYGERVKEILPLVTIYPVPGAADYIPGVINNRGEIESVININRFLGLADPAPAATGRIALAEAEGVRSGILVDSIEEVLDIPVSAVKPPLDTIAKGVKELVAGQFHYADRQVTLLDLGRIFSRLAA
ncbi:MAG: chemotaxis protein CheW [Desulfobacteraceae bacterium]|nr:chemotaxis protein CheW [Desulfobacteraceae bacterium]